MSHDKHPHHKPHEKPEPVFTTQDDEPTLPTPGSGGGGSTDPDKPKKP